MNLKEKIINIESLIEKLNISKTIKNIDENFNFLTICTDSFPLDDFLSSFENHHHLLIPFLKLVDLSDKIEIQILNAIDESIIVSFIEIDSLVNYIYGDEYEDTDGIIKIIITKNCNNSDYLTIYSLTYLTNFLEKKNLELIFDFFSNAPKKFKILDGESQIFSTKKFVFADSANFENRTDYIVEQNNKFYNNEKYNKIMENCHFANSSKIKFLPEDFYISSKSKNEAFNKLFNKLSLSLILSVFSNTSEFKDDSLSYKMYGYKAIKSDYTFKELKTTFIKDYFDSYEEVFNNLATISDKIGLARNIITLHIVDNDFTEMQGSIYASIKSNYNIYLKENVKKYIDVKNKIADTLFSLSTKFDNAVDDLTSSFRSSFYTLATLLVSIILYKVIKTTATTAASSLFTIEVFLFLFSILIAMFIFKKYVVFEINEKNKRFSTQYEQLKNQYRDILDPDDLKQIFDKNGFFTI